MDTPLYVLSTAASMVESVDVAKCQNVEEAPIRAGDRHPAASVTPMACPMSTPYRDCRQIADVSTDSSAPVNGLSDNRKKCAGTQTSFSSFGGSPYAMSEKYVKMDSGSAPWHGGGGGGGSPSAASPPPPGYYQPHNITISIPQHHHHQQQQQQQPQQQPHYGYGQSTAASTDVDMDDEMPLNLTKSSSTHQSNSGQNSCTSGGTASSPPAASPASASSQHQLSSERAAASSTPRTSVIIRNQPTQRTQPACNKTRDARVLGSCDDPEIEEHFRRSLGTKYQSYMVSCSSPRNGETAEPTATNCSNVSITGNVDDHFAKSLGETWTRLNAQKQTSLTGTVDDHFAKALGETWYKIKAKVETESRPSASVVHL